jgi:MscS family membrane protein
MLRTIRRMPFLSPFLLLAITSGLLLTLATTDQLPAQTNSVAVDDEQATEPASDDQPAADEDSEAELDSPQMVGWLDALLPPALDNEHFGLRDAQWLCLLALIAIGFLGDVLIRRILVIVGKLLFKESFGVMERKGRRRIVKPIGLLGQAVIWYWGTDLIGLPNNLTVVLGVALKLFTVVAGIWTAFMVIDLVGRFMKEKAESTETKFDDLLVPLITKTLKVFTVCVGLVLMADLFQLKITALIGGLGLGGMALALASQDALQNVFGSLLVLTDRPFEIGDWIVAEGVEGTVESVGVRSTRIRTFENSQVIIPNSKFTQSVVNNMGRRQFRRLRVVLGLEYDSTPQQLDAFCEGVRELIRRGRFTRNDVYHVYFNNFGDNSLDILMYCFIECEDYASELQQRHELFMQVLQLADQLGLSFAFPTRTIHMFQQDGTPAAKPTLDDPEGTGRELAGKLAGPEAEQPEHQKPLEAGLFGTDHGGSE